MMAQSCENCLAYHAATLECRFDAPIQNNVSSTRPWTIVNADDWCMKWTDGSAVAGATKAWTAVVNGQGVMTYPPASSGWTLQHLSTGYYRVTHGLGRSDYTPLVSGTWTVGPTVGRNIEIIEWTDEHVEVMVLDGLVLTDGAFNLVLVSQG
jgi:hypothetical protein